MIRGLHVVINAFWLLNVGNCGKAATKYAVHYFFSRGQLLQSGEIGTAKNARFCRFQLFLSRKAEGRHRGIGAGLTIGTNHGRPLPRR